MFKLKYILGIVPFLIISSSCSDLKKVETYEDSQIVEFPDGSVVYLNSHSSVAYARDFDSRSVALTGEAFFVVRDNMTPFMVSTALGEIRVLGTEFNIKTNEQELEVEVERGSVELRTVDQRNKLVRGESGIYKKGQKSIQIGKARFNFKAWRDRLKEGYREVEKQKDNASQKIEGKLKKKERKLIN